MKEQIVRLTNKMVRINRVIQKPDCSGYPVHKYDQSIVGVIKSTGDADFQFCLNNENKTRTWKYGNIKNIKDLTDN